MKIKFLRFFALLIFSVAIQSTYAQIREGVYRIQSKNSMSTTPKYITLNRSSNLNFAEVSEQVYSENNAQLWIVKKLSTDGDFRIISKVDENYCLSTRNLTQNSGSDQTFTYEMNNVLDFREQTWKFNSTSDGSIQIVTNSINKTLSVEGDADVVGAFIKIYDDVSKNSQRFFLLPVDLTEKVPTLSGNGLMGYYFNNTEVKGDYFTSRLDTKVDFSQTNWIPDGVGVPLKEKFSVRWEGQIEAPITGKYKFNISSSNAVKLFINDLKIIDNPNGEKDFEMRKGEKYNIKVEYYNSSSPSQISLKWNYNNGDLINGQTFVIPTANLYGKEKVGEVSFSNNGGLALIGKWESRVSTPTTIQTNPEQVLLRWIPNSAGAWLSGNNSGYEIKRTLIKRNNVVISNGAVQTFIVKPEPENSDKWGQYKNRITALKNKTTNAQALSVDDIYCISAYSTLYMPSKNNSQGQYFNMMLMANLDYKAARLAGLGFTDNSVVANEEYSYAVSIKDKTILDCPSSSINIKLGDGIPVKANTPTVIFDKVPQAKQVTEKSFVENKNLKDKSATVKVSVDWTTIGLEQYYSSYWVERSTDGIRYIRRGRTPSVNLASINAMQLLDSVPFYKGGTYYYRIVGRSFFESSDTPPNILEVASLPIVKQYIAPLDDSPEIKRTEVKEGNKVLINWEFPANYVNNRLDTLNIKGFYIEKCATPDGTFTRVLASNISQSSTVNTPIQTDGLIDINAKEITILNLIDSDYYRVVAVDKEGIRINPSGPMLIQLMDSQPPAAPTWLSPQTSAITYLDELVTLKWNANSEPDVAGYKLFRKNDLNDKYPVEVDAELLKTTEWSKKLDLGVSNQEIYFYLAAIDKKGNQSEFSVGITLRRPDKKEPTAPLFINYEIFKTGGRIDLRINWKKSPDQDIVSHTLSRKDISINSNGVWVNPVNPEINGDTYLDRDVGVGKKYVYNVSAKDQTGFETLAIPIIIDIPKTIYKPDFLIFNGLVNSTEQTVSLDWQYTADELATFEVHKANGNEPYTSWKIMTAMELKTLDPQVGFKYQIRAVFNDGSTSNWREWNTGCKVGFTLLKKSNVIQFKQSAVIDKSCLEIQLIPGCEISPKGNQSYEATISNN